MTKENIYVLSNSFPAGFYFSDQFSHPGQVFLMGFFLRRKFWITVLFKKSLFIAQMLFGIVGQFLQNVIKLFETFLVPKNSIHLIHELDRAFMLVVHLLHTSFIRLTPIQNIQMLLQYILNR